MFTAIICAPLRVVSPFFYSASRAVVRKMISDALVHPDVIETYRWCTKKKRL